MKRILPLLLCFLLLIGCTPASENRYVNESFSLDLPTPFEPVSNPSVICFAPYGDALLSSSVTVYATELNWYFDRFCEDDYAEALKTLCGYDDLTLVGIESRKIDGCNARRISCKVQIDQGEHDLILYAIEAERCYFFTLLNREGDSYIDSFDSMMQTVRFREGA